MWTSTIAVAILSISYFIHNSVFMDQRIIVQNITEWWSYMYVSLKNIKNLSQFV